MKVIVEQAKSRMSRTAIATYDIGPCYFILLDGFYGELDDTHTHPFVYLKHHDRWIGEDEGNNESPTDILCSFLNEIVDYLKMIGPIVFLN